MITIPHAMKDALKLLAGVNEEDYTSTDRGVKFSFKNSQQANQCQIMEYHDGYILELRKKTDNILEGVMDRLVFEQVIKTDELLEVFENRTGIYLSYMS